MQARGGGIGGMDRQMDAILALSVLKRIRESKVMAPYVQDVEPFLEDATTEDLMAYLTDEASLNDLVLQVVGLMKTEKHYSELWSAIHGHGGDAPRHEASITELPDSPVAEISSPSVATLASDTPPLEADPSDDDHLLPHASRLPVNAPVPRAVGDASQRARPLADDPLARVDATAGAAAATVRLAAADPRAVRAVDEVSGPLAGDGREAEWRDAFCAAPALGSALARSRKAIPLDAVADAAAPGALLARIDPAAVPVSTTAALTDTEQQHDGLPVDEGLLHDDEAPVDEALVDDAQLSDEAPDSHDGHFTDLSHAVPASDRVESSGAATSSLAVKAEALSNASNAVIEAEAVFIASSAAVDADAMASAYEEEAHASAAEVRADAAVAAADRMSASSGNVPLREPRASPPRAPSSPTPPSSMLGSRHASADDVERLFSFTLSSSTARAVSAGASDGLIPGGACQVLVGDEWVSARFVARIDDREATVTVGGRFQLVPLSDVRAGPAAHEAFEAPLAVAPIAAAAPAAAPQYRAGTAWLLHDAPKGQWHSVTLLQSDADGAMAEPDGAVRPPPPRGLALVQFMADGVIAYVPVQELHSPFFPSAAAVPPPVYAPAWSPVAPAAGRGRGAAVVPPWQSDVAAPKPAHIAHVAAVAAPPSAARTPSPPPLFAEPSLSSKTPSKTPPLSSKTPPLSSKTPPLSTKTPPLSTKTPPLALTASPLLRVGGRCHAFWDGEWRDGTVDTIDAAVVGVVIDGDDLLVDVIPSLVRPVDDDYHDDDDGDGDGRRGSPAGRSAGAAAQSASGGDVGEDDEWSDGRDGDESSGSDSDGEHGRVAGKRRAHLPVAWFAAESTTIDLDKLKAERMAERQAAMAERQAAMASKQRAARTTSEGRGGGRGGGRGNGAFRASPTAPFLPPPAAEKPPPRPRPPRLEATQLAELSQAWLRGDIKLAKAAADAAASEPSSESSKAAADAAASEPSSESAKAAASGPVSTYASPPRSEQTGAVPVSEKTVPSHVSDGAVPVSEAAPSHVSDSATRLTVLQQRRLARQQLSSEPQQLAGASMASSSSAAVTPPRAHREEQQQPIAMATSSPPTRPRATGREASQADEEGKAAASTFAHLAKTATPFFPSTAVAPVTRASASSQAEALSSPRVLAASPAPAWRDGATAASTQSPDRKDALLRKIADLFP